MMTTGGRGQNRPPPTSRLSETEFTLR